MFSQKVNDSLSSDLHALSFSFAIRRAIRS